VVPSYVPLRAKQLLSETILSTVFNFRDIGLDHIKWDILYMYCKAHCSEYAGCATDVGIRPVLAYAAGAARLRSKD